MTNPVNAFQPAIDALEQDYADLERQATALLTSINLLRSKAGLPPRPGGWSSPSTAGNNAGAPTPIRMQSDTFAGKKLGTAVREYLEMRKASGADKPATAREIFDALKEGGFESGAKDDATAMVVLRTMLRKNTTIFVKLRNGKYGLRSWYPNLKPAKEAHAGKGDEDSGGADDEVDVEAGGDVEAEDETDVEAEKVSAA